MAGLLHHLIPRPKDTIDAYRRTRFLFVRMLLLRPVIIAMAQDSFRMDRSSIVAFGLSQDLMKAMGVLCVQTAHSLIALLYENLDTYYRSTAWHSVYCRSNSLQKIPTPQVTDTLLVTYSAATVLLASQMSVLNEAQAETGSYEVSWTRCMTILKRYARQFPPSSKAISVLWALRGRISSRIAHCKSSLPNILSRGEWYQLTDVQHAIPHVESRPTIQRDLLIPS